MTRDEIDELLTLKLSKRELTVYLAMRAGHLEIYDIQQVTGLRRNVVVEAIAQIVQVTNVTPSLRKQGVPKEPAQNVQRTPPLRILDFLYRSLGRPLQGEYDPAELTRTKAAYKLAYDRYRDQEKAVQLIEDCITAHVEADAPWFNGPLPGKTLQSKVSAYLSVLPDKSPVHIWQAEQAANGRFRYRYDHLRIDSKWVRVNS